MKEKQRLSNIELLRIVAIFLIVMMHAAGYALQTTDTLNRMAVVAINAVGNMGVTVFVLISGYFGIRFRWAGLARLWLTMLFYSLFLSAFLWISGQQAFSLAALYEALTPVTSRRWWFMSCYVVLYCLSPFLNRAALGLSHRQMEWLMGVLLFFFVLSPTFLGHELVDDMHGKGLPNFLTAYLVGLYIARYDLPAAFIRRSGWVFVACVALLWALCMVAHEWSPTAVIPFCRDNHLLIVVGAVALFCWVRKHPFHAARVNWLASYAFPLYLVNLDVIRILSPAYASYVNDGRMWLPWALVLLAVVGVTLVVETVRRLLLDHPMALLSDKINEKLTVINLYD